MAGESVIRKNGDIVVVIIVVIEGGGGMMACGGRRVGRGRGVTGMSGTFALADSLAFTDHLLGCRLANYLLGGARSRCRRHFLFLLFFFQRVLGVLVVHMLLPFSSLQCCHVHCPVPDGKKFQYNQFEIIGITVISNTSEQVNFDIFVTLRWISNKIFVKDHVSKFYV